MERSSVSVLFVEDSELDVELELDALRQDGFEVSWERVESEPELARALRAAWPQAVLSDFSMPGFDGLHALRTARDIAPRTPFIFVSGTIGEERAIEAIRLGATDYVLKDNLRRLGTALRRALAEAAEHERARTAEEERARLVEILEATSDYVGMSDPEGRQFYLNAAGRKLTGIAGREIPGKLIFEIYPPRIRELIEREARPVAERDGIWQGETAILGSEGTEIPVSQVIIAHRGPDGAVRFFSSIARDIRDRKAYEARIEYHANYDALTDLPNRRLLGDRVVQAITHARRTGRTCALLAIDCDGLRRFNDIYGHAAGDALLRAIADRLRAAVREGDTVARLGADAYRVLAADLARPEDAADVAEKIRDSLHAPVLAAGREAQVTASIGARVYPRDGEEFDLLLRNADAAAHRVKEAGGNGFQFYAAAMTRDAAERAELETELRAALQRKELEMYMQPQVTLEDGRITGVEALMRWRHGKHGSIPPAKFIPIAEGSELIHPLGEWALAESGRVVKAWERAGHAPLRVAVNVSARQFRRAGFVEAVARALRLAGLESSRLEIELTESVLIERQEEAIVILKELKARGVQIAIDDFGTGYSSLSYLSRLPIDCLKIDRSFVHRATHDRHNAAIAQAVVSLGHALGLRVLAEGVETAEQLEFLRAHGCLEGQGYLFSPPRPAGALTAAIAAGALAPGGQFAAGRN